MDPEDLLTDDDFAPLREALINAWVEAGASAFDLVRAQLGKSEDDLPYDTDRPAVRRMFDKIGDRVKGIEGTTRDRLGTMIERGVNEGLSMGDLAKLIEADESGAFNSARAMMIARTETGTAYNLMSLAGYKEGGVEKVLIFDGDGCGWDEHDDTDLADGSVRTLEDAEDHPLAHPNCFVGSTQVCAPNVRAAFARWFEGEVVVLRTALDNQITVTPNHPILTSRGWVAAGLLEQGDYVVSCADPQRVATLVDPDNDYVPSRIEEVARAVLEASGGPSRTMPSATVAFHGDGSGSDVYVVGTNGLCQNSWDAARLKHGGKVPFTLSDVGLGALFASGAAREALDGVGHSPYGIMGPSSAGASLTCVEAGHFEVPGFGEGSHRKPSVFPQPAQARPTAVNFGSQRVAGLAVDVPCMKGEKVNVGGGAYGGANGDSVFSQDPNDGRGTDPERLGDGVRRLAALISLDKVVSVERRQFSGHVYNLQTDQGWYIANGIIAHNCVRGWAPYFGDE